VLHHGARRSGDRGQAGLSASYHLRLISGSTTCPRRGAENLFEEDSFRSKHAFLERWGEELGLG
jgi:hypothetical protein